ncbi:MAG: MBL fold metallo-hydrolase [Saezia sp.]
MKLTVLADNNTLIDQYYLGEPAVSYYIEDGSTRLLLDVGYSDVFIQNAKSLGINLNSISTIAISHGHNDHTRGLEFLRHEIDLKNIQLVAHPDTFKPKIADGIDIGSPLSEQELASICKLTLSKTPLQLTPNITFLGEIPSLTAFEKRRPFGSYHDGDKYQKDFVQDDSALVYRAKEGLFIITGCSHSGICNIVEYAMQVCNESRVTGIIGGFHLFEVSPQLTHTIEYLKQKNIRQLYPCHCVSFAAKAKMNQTIPINEVGVGMTIVVE